MNTHASDSEMSGCVPALLAWYAKAAAVFPLYCTNEFALGPLVAVWRLLGVVRQSSLLFFKKKLRLLPP